MRGVWIVLVVAVLASSAAAGDANGRVYRGRVMDANALPVAGAKVNVYAMVSDSLGRRSFEELGAPFITSDGRFVFATATERLLLFTARKEGLACAWSWGYADAGDLRLGQPAVLIGEVVDENTKPVAGAVIRPYLSSESMGELPPLNWLVAKSDPNGGFVLAGLPEDVEVRLVVGAPRKATVAPSRIGLSRGLDDFYIAGQGNVRLVMRPEGRIEGVLIGNDGRPLPNRPLLAAKGRFDFDRLTDSPVSTDDKGVFLFSGLEAGEYAVRTIPTRGMPDLTALLPGVKVEAGKTVSGLRLEAAAGGILLVRVHDTKGKPVPRASVTALRVVDLQHWQAYDHGGTDANGVARFRLPPGAYKAAVWAEGFCLDREMEEPALQIAEGQTKSVKVEAEPFVRVRGVARDGNGAPVEGAIVRAWQGDWAVGWTGTTTAEGRFLVAYDGKRKPGGQTQSFRVVARHVVRGLAGESLVEDPDESVEIALGPANTIRGQVLGEDDKPIAGASIAIGDVNSRDYRWTRGSLPDTRSDARGQYEVRGVLTGEYALHVWADGFGVTRVGVAVKQVEGTIEPDKIILKAAKYSVSGLVRDANGNPVDGARVFARKEGSAESRKGRTDQHGKFTINKLVEGEVSVTAWVGEDMHGEGDAQAGQKDVSVTVYSREERMRLERGESPRGGPTTSPGGEDF